MLLPFFEINPEIAQETHSILELNKSERHIRGGEATKMKYKIIES
jgi:putative DeoR family transcriptional regulator (stage III sporulation protein D)